MIGSEALLGAHSGSPTLIVGAETPEMFITIVKCIFACFDQTG